jgi:hypothetical protein
MADIIPIRARPNNPLAYAPGVPPFDRANPTHVQAWNAMVALGWSEQRAIEREAKRVSSSEPRKA